MKRIILFLVLILVSVSIFSEEVIEWVASNGEVFEITVPDDEATLKEWYIKSIKLYQEEAIDHKKTLKGLKDYKAEVEGTLIPSYENTISDLNNLIDAMNTHNRFRPYFTLGVGNSVASDGFTWSASGEVGVAISNHFLAGISAGYPAKIELNLGWLF